MSVWVLFVIALVNGEPRTDSAVFTSKAACEAAQSTTVKNLLTAGVSVASVNCTEAHIGNLT